MKNVMLLAVLLVGCGSDGISDSKQLGDLSANESTDLCKEFAHDYPARTVDCGNGDTQDVGIPAGDCGSGDAPPATCTITVGQLRDCFDALYGQSDADVCAHVEPDACMALDNAEGC